MQYRAVHVINLWGLLNYSSCQNVMSCFTPATAKKDIPDAVACDTCCVAVNIAYTIIATVDVGNCAPVLIHLFLTIAVYVPLRFTANLPLKPLAVIMLLLLFPLL